MCLLSVQSLAQETKDINRDTTFANQIYFDIIDKVVKTEEDSTDISRLKIALDLYDKHSSAYYSIAAKGLYAYLIEDENIANEVILKAKNEGIDSVDIRLMTAYIMYAKKTYDKDLIQASNYIQIAYEQVEKPSRLYFDLTETLAITNYYQRNEVEMGRIVEERENLFNQEKSDIYKKWKVSIMYWKMYQSFAFRQFEKSILFGVQVLKENERFNSLTTLELLEAKLMIAYCEGSLGQMENAMRTAEEMSILLDKECERGNCIDYASMYLNLSATYISWLEYQKAIPIQQKTIEILSSYGNEKANLLGTAYLHLGKTYRHMEEYQKASVALKKALEFIPPETYERAFISLGFVELRLGKYGKALDYLAKSLKNLTVDFNPENVYENPDRHATFKRLESIISALDIKAEALYLKSEIDVDKRRFLLEKADETAELLMFLLRQNLESHIGFESSRLSQGNNMQNLFETLITIKHGLYEESGTDKDRENLFEAIEKQKGFFLIEDFAKANMPDSLFNEREKLVKKYRILNQGKTFSSKDSLEFFNDELYYSSIAIDDFWDKIKNDYPVIFEKAYSPKYINSQDVQDVLIDENSLLVSYSVTFEDVFIYAITKESQVVHKLPIEEGFFDKIDELRKLLYNPLLGQKKKKERFIQLSHQMYQTLLKPIEEILTTKKKLIILPQAELFYIPFEILLTSEEKATFDKLDFLVKKHTISYHYACTLLHEFQKKEAPQDHSFLGFAPVFDDSFSQREISRSYDFLTTRNLRSVKERKFSSLPNSKVEVETIFKLIGKEDNKTLLVSDKATKRNLVQQIEKKSYQFIHFATHGLVNYESPIFSGFACYPGETEKTSIYFANEIEMQDLVVDLVVLSSCESGIGQSNPTEGLLALNRSFIYSGAKNVVYSLWKVNDTYTKDLMINFYKSIIENKNPYSTALREAKLRMIANPETALPRYWAPFVLMGK